MNPRNIIIAIIAAAAIVGGLAWGLNQKQPVTAPSDLDTSTRTESQSEGEADSEEEDQPNMVVYTADGFSPASLTVKSGTAVQFVNKGGDPMWVASNPHPTHTGLAGFDANRAYGDGETYSFTFTKSGTWGYHNHLNSSVGATIIVE